MKCLTCNSDMQYKDLVIAEYYQCTKCGHEVIEYPEKPNCCNFPDIKTIRYYADETDMYLNNDYYIVTNQCQNCGKRRGNNLPKKSYDKEKLPLFDNELQKNIEKKREEIIVVANEISERKREKEREDFWDDYEEYLKSDKWQKIRELVFKRDNFLC